MTGFVGALTLFVFALFVGVELVRRVSPSLQAPLLSSSSALSGITLVGALLLAGDPNASPAVRALAGVAVACATTNVVAGLVATHRMLGTLRRARSQPLAPETEV
jgi:NAD(P) transhydrogenase subunit alpha